MKKISVVVPCYNEEDVIVAFHKEVTKELKKINEADYELIFVNDGSKDHTQDLLTVLSKKDKHCIYYTFSRNFGKEAAMYAGLQKAAGDYVVIMDADLQHPPRLLKPMYEAIEYEHYDCCAGKRVDRQGEGKIRNGLSHMFYKIINQGSNVEMMDGAGDYRMMTRQMVDAILEMKEYNRYMKGLFSFVGFDTKWIEFHNVERVGGTSKWNLISLFGYALQGIYSFSDAPVRVISLIGAMMCIMSIVFFILNIRYHTIYGMFLLLSGMNMVFISIIGEYASKGYLESKQRPVYIIKDTNR